MSKKLRKIEYILPTTLSAFAAFIIIFPIVWLLLSSFKPSAELFAYPLHLFPKNFTLALSLIHI